ncbi:hypothetical protein WG901_22165 [Novosphingobium sp. PS1R-30]|uniref:Heme exporter protein D n=1 Tax=Novosphingobium anseongense TaxID=3133436 RepID=A0ABU8S212_9SPHN
MATGRGLTHPGKPSSILGGVNSMDSTLILFFSLLAIAFGFWVMAARYGYLSLLISRKKRALVLAKELARQNP